MFKKTIHFIKYNNAVILIVLAIFVLGSGVFASTETGQEFIGEKAVTIEGEDNTLLLEADLDSFDMDFKIEKIERDDFYYYVTYTFLDLVKKEGVWQYEMQEKIRKVSTLVRKDLGVFLSEELAEQYEARIKDLKKQQRKNKEDGAQVKTEVSEYSGLIGQTLTLAEKVFPNYEAVKVEAIPSPLAPALSSISREDIEASEAIADDLTDIYNDYVANMDPDKDDIVGTADNCAYDYNPSQLDSDQDGKGDVCDLSPFGLPDEEEDTATSTEEATSTDLIVDDQEASSTEPIVEEPIEENTEEASAPNQETDEEPVPAEGNETPEEPTEAESTVETETEEAEAEPLAEETIVEIIEIN